MKYFLLRTSSDPKVIGVRNGIMQAEFKENKYRNIDSYNNLHNFFLSNNYWKNSKQFPDFEIEVNLELLKSAKETDFLSYGPDLMTCPFLITNKIAEIFKQHNISNYKLYPAKIWSKDGKMANEEYHLFCCPLLEYDIVDFEQSIFYTGNDLLKNKKYQPDVKSWEDYRTFSSKMTRSLEIEVLKMNDAFDNSLDYFQCRVGGIQISERLKDALVEASATGVNILDIGPRIIVSES